MLTNSRFGATRPIVTRSPMHLNFNMLRDPLTPVFRNNFLLRKHRDHLQSERPSDILYSLLSHPRAGVAKDCALLTLVFCHQLNIAVVVEVDLRTCHPRDRRLEEAAFLTKGTVPGSIYSTSKSTEISGATSSSGQGDSPVLNTKTAAVRAYCGDTSPWVSLVNHVDSKAEPDPQLQKTASR